MIKHILEEAAWIGLAILISYTFVKVMGWL